MMVSHLLWGDSQCDRPQVHPFIRLNTRQHKKYSWKNIFSPNTILTILTWAFSSPRQEPSKSENDRPLVFLDYLAVLENHTRETFYCDAGLLLSEGWNEQQNILDVMRWKFWNIGYTTLTPPGQSWRKSGKSPTLSENKCCVVVRAVVWLVSAPWAEHREKREGWRPPDTRTVRRGANQTVRYSSRHPLCRLK